jgi:hypothetical protein
MSGKEYFNAEGILIKYQGGKTIQETTLLKYKFDAGIKKVDSPRYKAYDGNINGQLVIDKNNRASTFLVYVEHNGYDIRFKFSYELMGLILGIRNSMYDLNPVRNPFYDVINSELNFDNLSFTPKLMEALTMKRIPLSDARRKQIILDNSKEILALKNKHDIDVSEFLKNEETENKQ